MKKRRWMIRTRSQGLLGPISQKKLLEILEKKLLGPQDEICSGNGHWFFLRDTQLLNQYVYQNQLQEMVNEGDPFPTDFVPDSENILEYKDKSIIEILESKKIKEIESPKKKQEALSDITRITHQSFPSKGDLEYPDIAPVKPTPSKSPPKLNTRPAIEKSSWLTKIIKKIF